MKSKLRYEANIFWQLLKMDLLIYKKDLFDHIVNGLIWISSTVVIFNYVLPTLGMSKNYGAFMLVGSVVSWSLFKSYGIFLSFISDINGDNRISYELTLPLSYWLVILRRGLSLATRTALVTLPILPFGKLLIWNYFDLSHFSFLKFLLIFIFTHLMTSFFGLFFVGFVKDRTITENLWCRVIFPIWYLGGAQFSWMVLSKFSYKLGILALFNPFLYLIEGMRGSVLGPEGYISFWICLLVAVFTTSIFFLVGAFFIKKRLDVV